MSCSPTADVRYGCEVHKKEEEIVKTRREKAAAAIMASLGAGKKVEKVRDTQSMQLLRMPGTYALQELPVICPVGR